MIFFSAHGVPVSYVEDAGDPYKDQMEECIFLIMQELKNRGINNKHTLAYQVSYKNIGREFLAFLLSPCNSWHKVLGFLLALLFRAFVLTHSLLFSFLASVGWGIRAELVLFNG